MQLANYNNLDAFSQQQTHAQQQIQELVVLLHHLPLHLLLLIISFLLTTIKVNKY